MSNAVVILGAGASADFGVPTLRGVFKDVNAQAYLRVDPILRPKLEQFFWQPRGHSLQTSEQSLTIEEMLTLLRDRELEPSLQTRPTQAEFEDFRRRLYVLIYYAVYSGKSSRGEHLNPLIEILGKKRALSVWLYKVAKTQCLMSRRKSKFAPAQMLSLDALMPKDSVLSSAGTKSWQITPEEMVLNQELRGRLEDAILALPKHYRLVLILRDMEQLDTREVAEVMGISEETTKKRLQRARVFVRNALAGYARHLNERKSKSHA